MAADAPSEDQRPHTLRPPPANKLSKEERDTVLKVVNEEPYQSLPPSQIVPKLADEGRYLASESTMYRLLGEADQNQHRGSRQEGVAREPETHTATGPNQVWTWDISWIKGPVKGLFFYLYLVMDLYSRKIVSWEVHEEESGDHAQDLIQKGVWGEHVVGKPLVLHADNGSPMKSATLLATLERLEIKTSYSRPRVSNDNAHVERLFGTAKYRPSYPVHGFETIQSARKWVMDFVAWYNEEHQHRSIGYVTPGQRHRGEDQAILAQRRKVYEAAKASKPERWSGDTRTWERPGEVTLNPVGKKDQPAEIKSSAA